MNTEDQHLYWFRILGLRYDGGYVDLNRVLLIALRQRASEHLIYNHFAGWEHELHIDAAGPDKLRCFYQGRRADRHSQRV